MRVRREWRASGGAVWGARDQRPSGRRSSDESRMVRASEARSWDRSRLRRPQLKCFRRSR